MIIACEIIRVLEEGPCKPLVKESFVHVDLMKRPMSDGCNCKKHYYGAHLGHRGEGLVVIDVLLLSEALHNESRLVTRNGPILIIFYFVGSLTSD